VHTTIPISSLQIGGSLLCHSYFWKRPSLNDGAKRVRYNDMNG